MLWSNIILFLRVSESLSCSQMNYCQHLASVCLLSMKFLKNHLLWNYSRDLEVRLVQIIFMVS